MRNGDIFCIEPKTRKLENDGVALVENSAETTLRYELSTFVCTGKYEEGMERILHSFLNNISRDSQPAVWISGFYGSGKSHLVKMLSLLWSNHIFSDGANARDIAHLPQNIKDLYDELTSASLENGGLHTARGKLSAGASVSIRMLILNIIFKSIGLPVDNYEQAKFVLWLRSLGKMDEIKNKVEAHGGNWGKAIRFMYADPWLHNALKEVMPEQFDLKSQKCNEIIKATFPHVNDISDDEMINTIHEALDRDAKFPLTLLVLDELQQYISDNQERVMLVQEAVETLSQRMKGKFIVVATGQSAIRGTPSLQRIEARFPLTVELSDNDIDTVIRKVVLMKKPEYTEVIKQKLLDNIGAITKQLQGTQLAYTSSDVNDLVADYPILPMRRRFWEQASQMLDQYLTAQQAVSNGLLRNQLKMTLQIIQENAEKELGNVAPGDYLFFYLAETLLRDGLLSRAMWQTLETWKNKGTEEQKLMARACGLIFLINKLKTWNSDIGISATIDTLADLMMEDLSDGGAKLRAILPRILDPNSCELLQKVGDEYRLQTTESLEWKKEFENRKNVLKQESYLTDPERDRRLEQLFNKACAIKDINCGKTQVARKITLVFNKEIPSPETIQSITLWVRDGWHIDSNSFLNMARSVGVDSPVIFAFIPKLAIDELRRNIIDYLAAKDTLDVKGSPNTPEGREAFDAMTSTLNFADGEIKKILNEALAQSIVYQGGGNEVSGQTLPEKVKNAAITSSSRLYSEFEEADEPAWSKVYESARKGEPDALRHIHFQGNPKENPICNKIIDFIGTQKNGQEIRKHFEESPFGWPIDTIDGALQILLLKGDLLAIDSLGNAINEKLDHRGLALATNYFKVESVVLSTTQIVTVRGLYQKMNIPCTSKSGVEELLRLSDDFLGKIINLAENAGGHPPRPEKPDTQFVSEIITLSGNTRLLKISELYNVIEQKINEWTVISTKIQARMVEWQILDQLMKLSSELEDTADAKPIFTQCKAILENRLLLNDPDLIPEYENALANICRERIGSLKAKYDELIKQWEEELSNNETWKKLKQNPQDELAVRRDAQILNLDLNVQLSSTNDLIETLKRHSLQSLDDKIRALPSKYTDALRKAAEKLEPKLQYIHFPPKRIESEADIEEWLAYASNLLKSQLKKGPVQI